MASTTKRRFTDEFKREEVALGETSGRMRTEGAAELGGTAQGSGDVQHRLTSATKSAGAYRARAEGAK